ncbi:hypothetical protein SESBI_06850 [Sesbania bispinosa]|nr:hypothetical protein SESBI_06850 [Sesbania bispinosa]
MLWSNNRKVLLNLLILRSGYNHGVPIEEEIPYGLMKKKTKCREYLVEKPIRFKSNTGKMEG